MDCKLCGGILTPQNYLEEFDRMGYVKDKRFIYNKCGGCGTWNLMNIPADLNPFYPPDSYYSYDPKNKDIPLEEIPPIKRSTAKYFVDTFALTEKSTVLDYGGGSNLLLRCMHDQGVGKDDGSTLIVYEPYAPESYISKEGIKLQREPITNLDNSVDFLILNHVIEHALDPLAMLQDCRRLINKRQGRIYLGFPNSDSLIWDAFGGHVPEIDAPRHIVAPTPKGIESLIAKSGLKLAGHGFIHCGTSFSPFFGMKYKAGKGYLDKWDQDKPQMWQRCEGFAYIANELKRGSAVECLLADEGYGA